MIYFDNAATSYPKPNVVYDEVNSLLINSCGNPSRSGHKLALSSGRIVFEAREEIAKFFNIKDSNRVIFTLNATDSSNMALKGYLKKGDHVITTTMEHNAILRPLKKLELKGIETTYISSNKSGIIEVKDIEKSIKENTKLIITTHASNVTGVVMPIKEIGSLAKKASVKFMVDAAQTAGFMSIDVEKFNIDFLVFTGHKGLYGIQGVGGLYLSSNVDIDTFREGGTGSNSESLVQPLIYPDKLESGTLNTPGIAGLLAGIKFINHLGIKNIKKHEIELAKYFVYELRKIDNIKVYGWSNKTMQTAVVSINIASFGSSDISYILDRDYNIATRSGLHCAPLAHKSIGTLQQGTVRFSLSYFNTLEEINKALSALKKIVDEAY